MSSRRRAGAGHGVLARGALLAAAAGARTESEPPDALVRRTPLRRRLRVAHDERGHWKFLSGHLGGVSGSWPAGPAICAFCNDLPRKFSTPSSSCLLGGPLQGPPLKMTMAATPCAPLRSPVALARRNPSRKLNWRSAGHPGVRRISDQHRDCREGPCYALPAMTALRTSSVAQFRFEDHPAPKPD